MKDWIIKRKSQIIEIMLFFIEILLSLVIAISIYKIAYKYEDFRYISKPYLISSIIVGIGLISLIIRNIRKYKNNIGKIFLTFILPLGIMYLTLIPMDWVPDECGHMFKTYDISLGNLITPFGEKNEGDIYVPEEMLILEEQHEKFNYSSIHKYMQKEADYKKIVPVQTIAKTYFPINYITGAVTFAICRGLNINIILACYLVRLINFIIFTIIGYICIKIVPFGKLLMAIYMMLPMIIHQSASLSADVFINEISLLFIAYNLNLLYQEKDVDIKQKVLYYVLAFSISICKYVYFPLAFMSLILIKNKNISKRNKIELAIVPTILSIIAAGGWFLFSQKYVDVRAYIVQANVNPTEQIKFILKKPFEYIDIFKNNLLDNTEFYLFSFAGQKLGALNVIIPDLYPLVALGGLLLVPFFEKNDKAMSKWLKILFILIAVAQFILIVTGLYITWTPLQFPKVAGVQGRYFVPVFILVLFACVKEKQYIETKNVELKFILTFAIINILTLIKVFQFFF